MRISPIFLVIVIVLTSCSRTQPVYNVTDRAFPEAAKNLSLTQIGNAIIASPEARGWALQKISEGVIKGEITNRKHYAEITINYNTEKYSITYSGSRNLMASGTEIHSNYNKWIKNLEDDIWQSVARAAAYS